MFILGLFVVLLGVSFVVKTEFYINNFGRIGFFENYLASSGGSRLGYKIMGFAGIFFGTLLMTGLMAPFMGWILAPLLRRMLPPGTI